MEQYEKTRIKLGFALKEETTSSALAALVVKTEPAEGVFVVDVEGTFPNKPKEKFFAFTSASTSNPIFLFSRYVHVTQEALASLGTSPYFDHLQEFQFYLEEEYGGFCRD